MPPSDVVAAHFAFIVTIANAKYVIVRAHERVTALAWEQECATANALARQLPKAEQQLEDAAAADPFLEFGELEGSQAYETVVITNLHAKAAAIQNIRSLVPSLHDLASSTYARCCDLILLTL